MLLSQLKQLHLDGGSGEIKNHVTDQVWIQLKVDHVHSMSDSECEPSSQAHAQAVIRQFQDSLNEQQQQQEQCECESSSQENGISRYIAAMNEESLVSERQTTPPASLLSTDGHLMDDWGKIVEVLVCRGCRLSHWHLVSSQHSL